MRGLLGDLPGTAGAWTGWRFHDGHLLSPAGERFTPGEVRGIILGRQLIDEQRREIDRLRARVAVLEQLAQEAANEWRAA